MGSLDFFKAGKKVYVKSPSDAPKGAQIHTGPKGGYYYYSTDDPDSPDYEGVEQPAETRDSDTKGPWKQDVTEEDLSPHKDDKIPKAWKEGNGTKIMREMSELKKMPEDYETWERKEEWEETHKMLPEYIETYPEETLRQVVEGELPIYTGNIRYNDISRPLGADEEKREKRAGRFIQSHHSEEWKVGDASVWVPLRNNYYKQNIPDQMQDKLNMCSVTMNAHFEDAPNPCNFVAFTPKEATYGFTYFNRNDKERLATGWGSCAAKGWDEPSWYNKHEKREGQPETWIQIYNNSPRNDQAMWHELGHAIGHNMETPKLGSTTGVYTDSDGKEYSQDWNDGWIEEMHSGWNTKDFRAVNVKKMKDWNAFAEKWKDKWPASGTKNTYSYRDQVEDASPWNDMSHTCKIVGEIMKEGRDGYFSREIHEGYTGNAPALRMELEEVPVLDSDGKQRIDFEGNPRTELRHPGYSDSKFDWVEEMHDDLVAMFGKKADIGKEPEWGWEEDRDGTWNTGDAWGAFKNLMDDRTKRFDKEITFNELLGGTPEEQAWMEARQKLGDEIFESVKKPGMKPADAARLGNEKIKELDGGQYIKAGHFSSGLLPTMENMNAELPKKGGLHGAVTWTDQEMKDMQNAKNLIKMQGRYNSGFTTAWKYEPMRDFSGRILEYGNQSAVESFADSYGYMLTKFNKLKNYDKMGLPAAGKRYEVKAERDKGRNAWLEKEEKKEKDAGGDWWNWETRRDKKEEYNASWEEKLNAAEDEDWDTAYELFDNDEGFLQEWSNGFHKRDLVEFSEYNPYKWDWWSRNVMSKELKKYNLPLTSNKENIEEYESKEGKKARERKEKSAALRYEREHGELPEGWYRSE